MPGKIERQSVSPRQKLERAAPAEAPQKAAPAAQARPSVSTEFSSQVAAGPLPAGEHVALSARPDALWGNGGGRGGDDPAAIAALSPVDRAAKLVELQGRRDAMQARIVERVTQLEKKWKSAPAETKEAALHEYLEASQHLDPGTRRELRGKLEDADDAHERIDRLLERREGLPPARSANAEMRARRSELAKELKAARKDEKQSVNAATQVIDDAGLEVDLLAVTEQKLDPSAPKAGSEGSLTGMLKSFFSLSWLTRCVSAMGKITDHLSEKKARERELLQIRDLGDQQSQQRLVANREALKQLTAALGKSA